MTASNDYPPPKAQAATPRWAKLLAHFILHLARVSRLWPIRWLVQSRVRQLGGLAFTVARGHDRKIAALYLPAQHSSRDDQQPDAQKKPPIVVAHGWLETKEFHLREARLFLNASHDVILVDLAAHGQSTGPFVSFGVHEKHDLASVITEAQQRGWVGSHVLTYGYSLGAAAVLQHAQIDARVIGVIAMAPYWDMATAVRSFHRVLTPWLAWSAVLAGFVDAAGELGFSVDDASTYTAVAAVDKPTLFIVGLRDLLLPGYEHTVPLYASKKHGLRRLVQVHDAGHLSVCYRHRPSLLDQAIITFISQVTDRHKGLLNARSVPESETLWL